MLDVEQRSGVTVLRLCHGKVSALDLELLQALSAALGEVDEAAPVVITGTGSAFSAGVDLRRIVDGGPSYAAQFLPALTTAFLAIFDHPGPVVAAVNGHAIAGGCVIAAACDVRLMSQGTIGLAELSVGVPFPASAMEIMRHAAGPAAGRLALGAPLLDPAGARAIGLVDDVVAPESVVDLAVGQAGAMGRTPAGVFAFTKRQLQRPARERLAAARGDDEAVLAMWSSAETRDRISAYLERLRRPAGKM
jgi:enoyl-CoA hydratase